jgi:hypothetical protein
MVAVAPLCVPRAAYGKMVVVVLKGPSRHELAEICELNRLGGGGFGMEVALGGMVLGVGCVRLLIFVHRHRFWLSKHTGMMVAMAGATMAGLLSGTVLGILFGGNLFLPTELAMLFSLSLGYWLGKPSGLLAAVDGIVAGIMGGMMGAMLGVMVLREAPDLTIVLMAVLFLCVTQLLVQLIREEAEVAPGLGVGDWVMWGGTLLMVAALGWQQAGLFPLADAPSHHSHHPKAVRAEQLTRMQVAQALIDESGWSGMIQAKAGIPLRLQVVSKSGADCGQGLQIDEFQISTPLADGKATVQFTPIHPGTYPMRCGAKVGWLLVE